MKNNFSVLFWFRKDVRSTLHDGYISARITLNGKRAEIATGFKVPFDRWNAAGGCMKGNKEDARTINVQLTAIENHLNDIFHDLQKSSKTLLTVDLIKNTYLGKGKKERTLMEVFQHHNAQMKAQVGSEYAQGTLERYETVLKLLQEFLHDHYQREDIYLSELNYEFITNMEFYFKTVRKCAHNTTIKYITNLRKIIHLAVKNEWMEKDPFVKFKCSLREVRRDALTEEELQRLQDKPFAIARIDQVRDVFIFCCYTGLAYADIYKLSPAQIGRGIDGKYWIFTDRTKTKTATNVPLLSPAVAILDKYRDHPEAVNRNRLFPVLSNQKMNAYLKEIADLCGITKRLTTHVARHTFATTVTLTNGVPLETVSSMLGHKSIKTTQIYAKVVQKKVSREMEALENKLIPKVSTDSMRKAE